MIQLGTDPELFGEGCLATALTDRGLPVTDAAVPAFFLMGLQDPTQHTIHLPHGELTPDGLALEFTVNPTSSVDEMIQRIRDNIAATKVFTDKLGGKLSVNPRIYVDPRYIERLPESYGKACSLQILGCDPDFCVYDHIEVPHKPNPKKHPYRTSGGHIHLGLGKAFVSDRAMIAYTILMLDATIGAASTILCDSEEAYQRKEQYGLPGMYRVDERRGTLEYRTLPAQALIQTPALARLMFTKAAEIGNRLYDLFIAEGPPAVIDDVVKRTGGLEQGFELARYIRDHDIPGCLDAVRYDEIGAILDYEMPNDFYLHGWEQ